MTEPGSPRLAEPALDPRSDLGADTEPVVRCGVDVAAIDRIRRLRSEFGDSFTRRVFTDSERQYCDATGTPAEHYAARWAAKEAFRKTLSGVTSMPPFGESGVRRRSDGPTLWLGDAAAAALERSLRPQSVPPARTATSVSLTHDRASGIAAAQVTILGVATDV
ncbi:holo-ACP synthase [Halomicrobium salinisoli]|uniref:holo-ACP synthase n=1 Tax=Halomicrobium salinisoli TaxID=2878391 RepID=UPI001CEFF5D3|nr:holo-ACP synthase [Halomicrobium salinisoli]